MFVAHEQRAPSLVPPGCHLRKGQWEEGQDKGALVSVVTLLYTHYMFVGGGIEGAELVSKEMKGSEREE